MILTCTKRRRKSSLAPFGTERRGRVNYTYSPYGTVTAEGDVTQPIQWSSEYHDTDLALVYYKTPDGCKGGWTCAQHAPEGRGAERRLRVNYRYYNPTDGRWTRRDPIGLYGGYNSYTGINNSPTGTMDVLGTYVVLCFAYKEGTIIGFDHSSPENTIEITDVVSGNGENTNNPDSQHVENSGPLPEGEYWIGEQYTPRDHINDAARGGDYDWFRLYGDDGNGGKSYPSIPVTDPQTGQQVTRGGFNLHTGQRSDGCITVWSDIDEEQSGYPHSSQYDDLKDFINDSGDREPFHNPRNPSDMYNGIMLVKRCLSDCKKALEEYK